MLGAFCYSFIFTTPSFPFLSFPFLSFSLLYSEITDRDCVVLFSSSFIHSFLFFFSPHFVIFPVDNTWAFFPSIPTVLVTIPLAKDGWKGGGSDMWQFVIIY